MKGRTLPEGAVTGSARIGPQTMSLARRLKRGEIAVIDHPDLDRISAEALLARSPAAVLNAAKSTTGRYPNLGPRILVEAGVLLVDDLGPDIMTLANGNRIRIENGIVYRGDVLIAEGMTQTTESVAAAYQAAHDALPVQLNSFVSNAAEYLEREQGLFLDNLGIPDIRTDLDGKQVVVVTAGANAGNQLRQLRGYISDEHPILVGVGSGADTLLEAGLTPDIVLGSELSNQVLGSGAELILHTAREASSSARAQIEALSLPYLEFAFSGASGDAALLLADAKGADLIVTVGAANSLLDFLDTRAGTPATLLTRLRVGGKLVDARAVAQLYNNRIATWQLVLLLVAGFIALGIALAVTPAGQSLFAVAGGWFGGLWSGITGLLS